MELLLLSRYGALPGPSRFRFLQYLPFLKQHGINVTVAPLLTDEWVTRNYSTGRFALGPLPAIYARRFLALFEARRYDAVWIEKEALPWLPGFVETLALAGIPYALDYDDAVFHTYDQHRSHFVRRLFGRKLVSLMRGSALVMAGNDYLRDYAKAAGAKAIEWVPSVVDLVRYPITDPPNNDVFTIGWTGAPANSRHLQLISDALAEVCRLGPARLHVIGGWRVKLPNNVPVEYTEFCADDPIEPVQRFDAGIMPLPDSPWERGKCGLKLIHYMACRVPTVASPVGVNRDIVEHGRTGFLASNTAEWIDSLCALRDSADLRRGMGVAGRAKVEQSYSLQVTAPRVAKMLSRMQRRQSRGSAPTERLSS
jgi:glycosyltransferase involved in cell wall biosynthesis